MSGVVGSANILLRDDVIALSTTTTATATATTTTTTHKSPLRSNILVNDKFN